MTTPGMKFDSNKLRYELVDDSAEAEFVAALTYGAIKYDDGNWEHVPNAYNRYYAAARRHMRLRRAGQEFDEESGLRHLALATCCIHFALAIEMRGESLGIEAKRHEVAFARAREMRRKRLEVTSAIANVEALRPIVDGG